MSEVEKVDKVLRGQRHGAAISVVGCAWVFCVLQRRNKHKDDVTRGIETSPRLQMAGLFSTFSFGLSPCGNGTTKHRL